jgi:hypothetical protein
MTIANKSHGRGGLCALVVAACSVLSACGSDGAPATGGASALADDDARTMAEAVISARAIDVAALDVSPEAGSGEAPLGAAPRGAYASGNSAGAFLGPRPLLKLTRAWGVELPPSCVSSSSKGEDADGDGIPVRSEVSLSCEQTEPGGRLVKLSGRVSVTDTDDHAAGSGFEMTFEQLTVTTVEQSGVGLERVLDGSLRVALRGTPPDASNGYELAHELVFVLTSLRGEAAVARIRYSLEGGSSFVPDAEVASVDPWAAGVIDGLDHETLSSGEVGVESWARGSEHSWTLATDPVLHWRRSCAGAPGKLGYDGGAVLLTDDAGSSLRVVYRGCNDTELWVNGRPLGAGGG